MALNTLTPIRGGNLITINDRQDIAKYEFLSRIFFLYCFTETIFVDPKQGHNFSLCIIIC